MAVATTSRSIYPDDLPISAWYQKEQRQKQQDQKMPPPPPCLRVDPSSPAPPRPCLVVGPGQFGGQVGLLGSLQPPELTKYLTVSEWVLARESVFQLANLAHSILHTHCHLLTYIPHTHTHTHTHKTKNSLKKVEPPSLPVHLAPTCPT